MACITLCGGAGTQYSDERTPAHVPMRITGFGEDFTGWMVREKLDGVAALWDGHTQKLHTRGGGIWTPPDEWKQLLPADVILQGELVMAVNHSFSEASGMARRQWSDWGTWQNLVLGVYDVPQDGVPYRQRAKNLRRICREWQGERMFFEIYPESEGVADNNELAAIANRMLRNGAEGVVIYDPHNSNWRPNARNYMRKIIGWFREEAVITGYQEGGGKYEGMLGAYLATFLEAPHDYVATGSGLYDAERADPAPIGAIISIKHKGRAGKNGYSSARMPIYQGRRPLQDVDEDLIASARQLVEKVY